MNLQSKLLYSWYYHPNFILHFVCKRDGITDRRTNKRTDRQTDDPITRCPRRTFQAGGIKIMVPCERSCHNEYTCNMKAISLLVRKLWPKLKFFKSRSNFKVKIMRSKIMVPCERSCHKEYTNYHLKDVSLLACLVRKLWPRLKFLFTHTC